ncbi:MAG: 16S rRNA (guanine(966)-N(2))-methyltransferase RsmD [Arenicella sp.]
MRRKQAHTKRKPPGQIRIIAGQWRGQKLAVADSEGLRPTSDSVRETVFNWLMPYIAGARCLDACAGTGALGFESLSRGAVNVDFVEKNRNLCADIKANIERFSTKANVYQQSIDDFLATNSQQLNYDLVFIDPPFSAQMQSSLCEQLDQGAWLADGALIYVEMPRSQTLEMPEHWELMRHKKTRQIQYALLHRAGPR